MPAESFHDLPDRVPLAAPGLKGTATAEQWAVLEKQAVATYICDENPCEECAEYCGDQMRLPEAEELIPQHPNCRCWYEWDWDPELSSLSVTSLIERVSERTPHGKPIGPFDDWEDCIEHMLDEGYSQEEAERICGSMESDKSLLTDTFMSDFTRTKSATASGVVAKTPHTDDDGDEYVRVPISSTNTDRDGDAFSEDGLKDLRDQIRQSPRPVFENHGMGDGLFGMRYDWKDIVGTQVDAEIEGGDNAARTLYSYIKPNPENERADKLLSYIKAGQAVGFSVGFRILEYDGDEDEGYEFHSTDLLETSAVGIQSNQEAVAGRGAAGSVEAMAAKAAGVDANLDEGTLAKAIVSETFARRGVPTDAQDDDFQTRDSTMTDDDNSDDYVTHEELKDALEEQQNDLVKGIAAELDGSLDEDDPDDEKAEGDEDSELKALAKQNADNIADLKDAVEDGEVEDAETQDKKTADGDETSGGSDTEKDTVGDDAEGWM